MEGKRYRLRKQDRNYFSRSGKTIFLNIPVTKKKENINFEEPIIDISSKKINAILVKLKGDEFNTPDQPVKYKVPIRVRSELVQIKPANLKRDGLLVVGIFYDADPLTADTIDIFRRAIIDADFDYHEAVTKLRDKFLLKSEKPKENDGDVIGGNG